MTSPLVFWRAIEAQSVAPGRHPPVTQSSTSLNMHKFRPKYNLNRWVLWNSPPTGVMNGEFSYRDQTVFVPGCKHVYFCCNVEQFNMGVCGDWLTFGASLMWSFKELQFLALLYWLHFSAACVERENWQHGYSCTHCVPQNKWSFQL